MPLQPLLPRRLYRQIAEQLRALIEHGEFPAGTRLPPERDLASQLGVSRPSVREALIALEVEGLVEVRIGSGIYVRTPDERAANDDLAQSEAGPFELLRARYVIEAECAAMAAKEAQPAQVAAIGEALELMRQEFASGVTQPLNGDRLFHLRIAEATGNGALVSVINLLWDERTGRLFQQLEHHYDTPALWEAALAEHRTIYDAIAAKDAKGAKAAMQKHMNQAYKRFSTGWDRTK